MVNIARSVRPDQPSALDETEAHGDLDRGAVRKPCDGVVSAGLAVPLGILDRMPRHRLRSRRSGWAILVALCALLVAGCTGTPDTPTGPDQQIAAFTGAWERLQTDVAATLTSDAAGASL